MARRKRQGRSTLMARARNIKPGFFKNEDLAELNPETRLLFIGLWTLADREGRLEDRPKRIKAELFAFDSFDVDSMLSELQSRSFLIRYEVDGGRFIQVSNFVKHQDPHYREKASEIPPPPGASNSIVATNVTRAQRQRIFERDGFKCRKCNTMDQLSIDHIVAVANGGDSSDANLQVLCYSCNFEKRAKDNEGCGNVEPTSRETGPGSAPLIPDSLIPESLSPPTPRAADRRPPPGKGDWPGFVDFYQPYPRKEARPKAQQAWNKLRPSPETIVKIVADVRKRASSFDWQKEGGRFVPQPATYLNQRRWEDEITAPPAPNGTHAKVIPAPAPNERCVSEADVLRMVGE